MNYKIPIILCMMFLAGFIMVGGSLPGETFHEYGTHVTLNSSVVNITFTPKLIVCSPGFGNETNPISRCNFSVKFEDSLPGDLCVLMDAIELLAVSDNTTIPATIDLHPEEGTDGDKICMVDHAKTIDGYFDMPTTSVGEKFDVVFPFGGDMGFNFTIDPFFSTNVSISADAEPALALSESGAANAVTLDNGDKIVVWETDDNEVGCANSTDDGLTWTAYKTAAANNVQEPTVATNGTRIYIVADEAGQGDLRYIFTDTGCAAINGQDMTDITGCTDGCGGPTLEYDGINSQWVMAFAGPGNDFYVATMPIDQVNSWTRVEVLDSSGVDGGVGLSINTDGQIWTCIDNAAPDDLIVYNSTNYSVSHTNRTIDGEAHVECDIYARGDYVMVVAEHGVSNDLFGWVSNDSGTVFKSNEIDAVTILSPSIVIDSLNVGHVLYWLNDANDDLKYRNLTDSGFGIEETAVAITGGQIKASSFAAHNYPTANRLTDGELEYVFLEDANSDIYWGNTTYDIINSLPTHNTPILNATTSGNLTTDNLTCWNQSTADADAEDVKNIYTWYRNQTSITILDMPFEGSSSNLLDWSSFGNNGVAYGNPVWSATSGYDGKGAYTFDGTGDTINLSTDASFNITDEITLSAWIKPTLLGDDALGIKHAIIRRNGAWSIQIAHPQNVTYFYITNNTGQNQLAVGTTVFSPNVWYFVTATFDTTSGTMKVYTNGVFEGSSPIGGTIFTNNDFDTHIGSNGDTNIFFNGTIDDPRIYNVSLSAEQILELYNNRTDLIVSQETTGAEEWNCSITPIDGTANGVTKTSELITIQEAAVVPNITITFDSVTALNSSQLDNLGLNSSNLAPIEFFRVNFTVITGNSNVSNWHFNFTANGTGACALGNLQSTTCYNYTNPTNKWIQFINNTVTSTYDSTLSGGNQGDQIIPTVTENSATNWTLSFLIDEHYNPNVFKWYNATYDFSEVKWQDGTDQRITQNNMIKVTLDENIIPLDADQYKLDLRANWTTGPLLPQEPLEAYLCNSTYSTGDPEDSINCALIGVLDTTDFQDDGTKFRLIFTKQLIDTLGDMKYVVLESHDINPARYYYIKTYNITNAGHSQQWEYSTDSGSSWSDLADGYETELNLNWFYNGATPTELVVALWSNNTNGDTNITEQNITWSVDPSQNYAPILSISDPDPNETVSLPYQVNFTVADPNDDTLNVSILLYQGGSLVETIVTDLDENDTTYNWTGTAPGTYNFTLEACELSTGDLFCTNDTHEGVIVPNNPPTHDNPILNATTSANTTSDNLTCYNQTTADPDSDTVTNIYQWYKDNVSIKLLDLPFEGSSTSLNDWSGGGNDGLAQNGPVWNSTGGHDGLGAYDFDGSDDYINISGLSFSNSSLSMTAWVYVEDFGATTFGEGPEVGATIFSFRKNQFDRSPTLAITNSSGGAGTHEGIVFAFDTDSYAAGAKGATSIQLNTWYHVAGVFEWTNGGGTHGGTWTVYLDGVLDSASSNNWQLGGIPPDIFFDGTEGRIADSNQWTNGESNIILSDFTIWNRSLSAEQIGVLASNQTNLIVSQETSPEEEWICGVVPIDGTENGTIKNSSTLSIVPVGCGQTLTEDTTLNQDLTSTGTCFTVGATDITIDCVGFSITGNQTGTGISIPNNNYDNLVITNCTIANFTNGMNGDFTDLTNFTWNTVANNTNNGIRMDDSDNCLYDSNTIYGNGNYGLSSINGSRQQEYATVINNTIYENGATGLYYEYSEEHNISNNLIYSNTGNGMVFWRSSNNVIFNNDIYNNSHGIVVQSAANANTISTNTISNNSQDGIYLQGLASERGIVINNLVFNNGGDGIDYRRADDYTTTNNTIYDNGAFGIFINQDSDDNQFLDNTLYGNTGTAITIQNANTDNSDNVFNNTNISSTVSWITTDNKAVDNMFRNTTFSNGNGSIRLIPVWTIPTAAGISQNDLNITSNNAFINVVSDAYLNVTAEITLNSLSFTNPEPAYDPQDDGTFLFCPTDICTEISYNVSGNNNFVFNVTHWTSYAAQEALACGINITNNRTLTEDLTGTGTCITIGANDITLECSGFTLTGNRTGVGIFVDGFDNTDIFNCNISNFSSGIQIQSSDNNNLTSNILNINRFYGIYFDVSSVGNTIAFNTIYDNEDDGLFAFNFNSSVIQHNTAYGQTGGSEISGLEINNGWFNNFTNNTVYSNTNGIHIDVSKNSTVINNLARDNQVGIWLDGSSSYTTADNIVYNNTVHNNTNTGIYVFDWSEWNNISTNNIFNHSQDGIWVRGNVHNNTIELNDVSLSGDNGIKVTSNSDENTVIGNTVYDSTNMGIWVSSSNQEVHDNTAYDNGLWGFYINNGTGHNVTGNTAYDNSDTGFYLQLNTLVNMDNNTAYSNTLQEMYFENSDNNIITNMNLSFGTTYIFIDSSSTGTNFTNLSISETLGSVLFPSMIQTVAGTNLSNQNLTISQASIFLNQVAIPSFDIPASLTFNNIILNNPEPTYDPEDDGDPVDCPSTICQNMSYSSPVYVYDVTGWTTYGVKAVASQPSGGGEGQTPQNTAGTLGINLSIETCRITYPYLLANGKDYSGIPSLQEQIEGATNRTVSWTFVRTYLDNWQELCSELINRTLEPELLCNEVDTLLDEKGVAYDTADILGIRNRLLKTIRIQTPVIDHYARNFDELCREPLGLQVLALGDEGGLDIPPIVLWIGGLVLLLIILFSVNSRNRNFFLARKRRRND